MTIFRESSLHPGSTRSHKKISGDAARISDLVQSFVNVKGFAHPPADPATVKSDATAIDCPRVVGASAVDRMGAPHRAWWEGGVPNGPGLSFGG